jgi:hypothetical protein
LNCYLSRDSNSDCDLPPKKRKMARVLVPQPSSKDKVLLDNAMDSTVDMDDVSHSTE